MTTVAIETSVLESLDFEIVCQATWKFRSMPRMTPIPDCENPATHAATIHQHGNCQWIEKFICEGHLTAYNDDCYECGMSPRIKDCKHLGMST